ncbi:MAG: TolC family protein [Vicingus serpentipes]|nr:TolC family protein [Vicingus serpentipes]
MKGNKLILIIALCFLNGLRAQENKVWSLKECVDYALENNISIKQSELDKASALEDVTAAKWSFFPNLNGSASQNYNFGSSISASGARVSADFRSNNFNLSSSVTLFNGFANIHTLQQANIGVEAQEAALMKMKNDISLNVVNSYLQILFAKEQLVVAESQVTISENEVNRTQELVSAGVLPKGDLLNIKSVLATDNQNLVIANNTYTIASLRLAQLLQLPEMTIEIQGVNVDVQDQHILSNTANDIYNKANETFPEIKLAELNIQSASKSIQLSKASFYPTLTMSYGLNTIYQHRQGYPDFVAYSDQLNDNLGNSLALSLNIPIFNRFQFRTNVNKAKITHQRVSYTLESERLRLKETIQTAYADALAASKAYDAATVSVEAQKEAFKYSRERFAAGAINSFDFNQTKNNLVAAESQLIRAKYDFVFKLKVLEFYYGIPFVAN